MSNADLMVITEADIKRFAPKAKREYLTAILANLSTLRSAGILESPLRWCHFMGQCGHETGGFTIIRESLHYKSVARIREVWPARFKSWSDEDMQKLVADPVALGDAVYGNRMGNKMPGDGCAFRGGGPLQTTGRGMVAEYAKRLGLDCQPELLNDCNITMQFACIEWQSSGCSEVADQNDILGVSKAINTGSATSGVMPVGMEGRREWFAKAWAVWGDKGKPDMARPKVSLKEFASRHLPTQVTAGGIGGWGTYELTRALSDGIPNVPSAATKSVENVGAWKQLGQQFTGLGTELVSVRGVGRDTWIMLAMGAGTFLLVAMGAAWFGRSK